MLKIRLKRVGRKHDPSFRLILTKSTSAAQTGNVIETLGSYDPRREAEKSYQLQGERILHWISKGAQPSDTVHNILVSAKLIEGKKVNVLPKKRPIVKEGEAAEAAPAPKVEAPAVESAPAQEPEAAPEEAAPAPEVTETSEEATA